MPLKKRYSRNVRFKNFLLFLWNPRKKLLCNKTCSQWGQFILYYCGFFFLLFTFFVVITLMALWDFTLFDTPWQELKLIKNPGLSVRPAVHDHLIAYSSRKYPSRYIQELEDFLKKYQNHGTKTYKDCSENTLRHENLCFFNVSSLGPCSKEPFGYLEKAPCVLLKLNKVYGWTPKISDKSRTFSVRSPEEIDVKTICKGLNPADSENIKSIHQFPDTGFPGYFFPYVDQKNYLQPLVGVQFSELTRDIFITVECSALVNDHTISSIIFQILLADSAIIQD